MGKDESLDTSTKGQIIRVSLRNFNEFFIIRRMKVKLPKTRVLEYNYEVIMRSITLFWLINCHPMTYSAVESHYPLLHWWCKLREDNAVINTMLTVSMERTKNSTLRRKLTSPDCAKDGLDSKTKMGSFCGLNTSFKKQPMNPILWCSWNPRTAFTDRSLSRTCWQLCWYSAALRYKSSQVLFYEHKCPMYTEPSHTPPQWPFQRSHTG